MSNFKEKTILVTGGTNGIGKTIAQHFYDEKAIVYLTGTNNSLINEINSKNDPRMIAIMSDFSSTNFQNDIQSKIDKIDKIDILVNNAGINKIDNFVDTKSEDFEKILNVNLKAPYEISKIVTKKMIKNKYGRIVNISSIFGKLSKPKRSLYSMSKFGIHGLTVALSAELSDKNILTNTVSPGFVNTDLTKKILSLEEINSLAEAVPIKRFAETEEIAKLVMFLSSNDNTYISGQNIMIDGGFSIV
jgi:3-oxoacyl-[acyl-carrier protein] reductase